MVLNNFSLSILFNQYSMLVTNYIFDICALFILNCLNNVLNNIDTQHILLKNYILFIRVFFEQITTH